MLLKIEEGKMVLQTRMTPLMMQITPHLEGRRRWLKGGGLLLENSAMNVDVLKQAIPDLEIDDERADLSVVESDLGPALGVVAYEPKTQPYAHQKQALEKARQQRYFALFMEQGTGKSKVAIDRAGELYSEGKISAVLLVGPKGVHRQWSESQLPTHMGCEWSAQTWPFKDLSGGDGLNWLCINIDAVKTPKGFNICNDFIYAHKNVLMILDESQQIKNSKSKRWVAANALGRGCDYRMILTGTPIAKDLTEEWAQFKWLDERIIGIRYMNAFRNRYCIMGGFEGRVVVGHKNVEELKEVVAPYSFRATKDDIGILPKAHDRFTFDLTAQQRSMMNSLKQDLIAGINSGEIVSASNAAVAVMRIQQVSNGFFVDEDDVLHRLMEPKKNPRIIALMELLETLEGKIVIWARFVEDIRQIMEQLGDEAVSYYGRTSDTERKSAISTFLDPGSKVRFFVSNPQAGGVGLNLQGDCQRAIYYSNSYSSIDRWQSEDRIHRIGTNGACVYTDLVAKASPDVKILQSLRSKKAISQMALGDIKQWMEEEW